jgi:hypothetical protein
MTLLDTFELYLSPLVMLVISAILIFYGNIITEYPWVGFACIFVILLSVLNFMTIMRGRGNHI